MKNDNLVVVPLVPHRFVSVENREFRQLACLQLATIGVVEHSSAFYVLNINRTCGQSSWANSSRRALSGRG
jgi:hypothetical protein